MWQLLSFIGGLDLCGGRSDTSEHSLFHMLKRVHSEEDYLFSACRTQIAGYLFSVKINPVSVPGSFNAAAGVLHWRAGPLL